VKPSNDSPIIETAPIETKNDLDKPIISEPEIVPETEIKPPSDLNEPIIEEAKEAVTEVIEQVKPKCG